MKTMCDSHIMAIFQTVRSPHLVFKLFEFDIFIAIVDADVFSFICMRFYKTQQKNIF